MLTNLGKEAAIALDLAYNIGSKAIAESFLNFMECQRKDNQNPETADIRTLIGFCMSSASQSSTALDDIAKVHLKENKKIK